MTDELDPLGLHAVAPQFPYQVTQPFRSVDKGEGASAGQEPCRRFAELSEIQGQLATVGIGGLSTAYREVGGIGNDAVKAPCREELTDLPYISLYEADLCLGIQREILQAHGIGGIIQLNARHGAGWIPCG